MTQSTTLTTVFLLSVLCSTQLSAATCDADNLHRVQQQYQHAQQASQWGKARAALRILSRCQPARGDLRIERLRLALLEQDMEAAYRHRRWLAEHDVPPALARLIDTWLAAAEAKRTPATHPAQTDNLSVLLTLSHGYDSNANDGSRHDSIPIQLNGLPLRWTLDSNSQAQASTFSELGLHAHASDRIGWAAGLSAKHYTALKEDDISAYALLSAPIPCPAGLSCQVQGLLNAQQQDEQEQVQFQLSLDTRWSQQQLRLNLRHSHERTAADSRALGLQWHGQFTPKLSIYAGLETDQPLDRRAGDTRHSIHIGTRIRPLAAQPLQLNLLHLREYESEPYSPVFWGDKKRDRRLHRVTTSYTWPLGKQLSLRLEAGWRRTNSDIELFQQHGWNTSLKLMGAL